MVLRTFVFGDNMTEASHKFYEEFIEKVIENTIRRIQNDYNNCDLRKDEFELHKDWIALDMGKARDEELMEIKCRFETYVDEEWKDIVNKIIEKLKEDDFVIVED